VYKSTDAGQSWKNITDSTVGGDVTDLAIDPSNPNIHYAGIVDTPNSGASNGVYKSSDGGSTWAALTNGVSSGADVSSIRLAVAPSNPRTVYATVFGAANTAPTRYRTTDPLDVSVLDDTDPLSDSTFVYRSDDAGASWVPTGTGIDTSQNGFELAYASQRAFVMDPNDPMGPARSRTSAACYLQESSSPRWPSPRRSPVRFTPARLTASSS
jgi:hypothetical protein